MDHIKNRERKVHPRDRANFLSNIFFLFSFKTYIKGFKRDLNEGDIYAVLKNYQSRDLGNELEKEWRKQKKSGKHFSITRLLIACYGLQLLFIGVILLIMDTSIVIIQPYAIEKLLFYFRPDTDPTQKKYAYFWAAILIGFNCLYTVYKHNFLLASVTLGIKIRTAFCSFIYRKALKLSPAHLGNISIGKIITLITKDVNTFEIFVHYGSDLWISIVKTIVVAVVLYIKIGISAVAGVGILVIALPIQFYLGSRVTPLKMKMCKATDNRLQITQETLSAIRLIKMYTWETIFNRKIAEARNAEMKRTFKISFLRYAVLIIGALTSQVALYVMLMSYISLGGIITAEIVYYLIGSFDMLADGLCIYFPLGIYELADLRAAIKRIGTVVKSMEVEIDEQPSTETMSPKIYLKNVTVLINKEIILHKIDLKVENGLTMITGPVGSGKSFFLKTILQDYKPETGSVIVEGRISYASQEPWLFPSSIRQNILFGAEFDEKRYQEVLRVCALNYDLALLADKDNTIVEDRGSNLSKGQQARISLARAVYKESEIYLLDDCLSALDAQVSSYIFRECVKGFLHKKLVIMVTHNAKNLPEADKVIVINHGSISPESNQEYIKKTINNKNQATQLKTPSLEEIEEDEDTNETSPLITEPATSKTVYQEENQSGEVNFQVYKSYIARGGGICVFLVVIFVFASAQFCVSFTESLVSNWVNLEQKIYDSLQVNSNSTQFDQLVQNRNKMFYIYTAMIVMTAVTALGRSIMLYLFAKRASIKLHQVMIVKIIYASMQFFDNNFIGNILNRFSKDLNTIDERMPDVLYQFFRTFFYLVGAITLISIVDKAFLIPTTIFLVLLVLIRKWTLRISRSLKRLDATTRSPMVGHLNATLEGLTTIRAFKAENILRDEFDRHQDLNTSVYYMLLSNMRTLAFIIDSLCACFIGIIIGKTVLDDSVVLAGTVGLAISQSLRLTGMLQWGIRQWTEVENQMTSVERVLEYTTIKQETQQGIEVDNWPKNGEIKYENVSLSYSNSKDFILKNINFVVCSNSKVGIVGRTGAGKSSIIAALFRLYEVDGKINIDGVDIKTLSLDFLRTHLSIIPQDPVLFSGTIRDNIDPMMKYTDSEVWQAIEAANLKKLTPSLDLQIADGGSIYSAGQKQLICLARAIVRNNKIVILDEATANMDQATDDLIQETLKRHFGSCTVVTIAHKLSTIMHSDRIMVLEKGEIVEYDQPAVLLRNPKGSLCKMFKKAGLLIESSIKSE